MKKKTKEATRRCPQCGRNENQINKGRNRSGTQRCMCMDCGITYTPSPKSRTYSEEVRRQAIKTYYSGVSGRGVGALFGIAQTMETLRAVAEVFVDAYNRFGQAKYAHRMHRPTGVLPFSACGFSLGTLWDTPNTNV